ncbi:hypothetical protein OIV83_004167 [Microbotryomycetes sp. JL201]|nr:hypothetical protein OIV83_004167 [Microbotryomycetes sp. JL201]
MHDIRGAIQNYRDEVGRLDLEGTRIAQAAERASLTEQPRVDMDGMLRGARRALLTAVTFAERLEEVTRAMSPITQPIGGQTQSPTLATSDGDQDGNLRPFPSNGLASLERSISTLRAAASRIDALIDRFGRHQSDENLPHDHQTLHERRDVSPEEDRAAFYRRASRQTNLDLSRSRLRALQTASYPTRRSNEQSPATRLELLRQSLRHPRFASSTSNTRTTDTAGGVFVPASDLLSTTDASPFFTVRLEEAGSTFADSTRTIPPFTRPLIRESSAAPLDDDEESTLTTRNRTRSASGSRTLYDFDFLTTSRVGSGSSTFQSRTRSSNINLATSSRVDHSAHVTPVPLTRQQRLHHVKLDRNGVEVLEDSAETESERSDESDEWSGTSLDGPAVQQRAVSLWGTPMQSSVAEADLDEAEQRRRRRLAAKRSEKCGR